MKKIILFLSFILVLHVNAEAKEYTLKLRTSYNPGYTRIVLEGPEHVITRAIVNETEQNILVTFLSVRFSIQEEKSAISFKRIDNNKILFSPGEFKGMKVLTLRNPDRIVIDLYKEIQKDESKKSPEPPVTTPILPLDKNREKEGVLNLPLKKKDSAGFPGLSKEPEIRSKTVMIDPGHGGFENGIVKDGYMEKNVVLDIARKLGMLVDKGSLKSSLTRSGDLFLSLDERVKLSYSRKSDVFISIHIGNHKDMVIYMPVITESFPENVKQYLYNKGQEKDLKRTVTLLNALKESINEDFGSDIVKVKSLPYSILSRIDGAALMVELPSFEYANYKEDFRLKVANALNKGLNLYEEREAN